MLTTIFIDQQRIRLPIGWHEDERIVKVSLSVSIRVTIENNGPSHKLNDTIDYGKLSEIIANSESYRCELLETYAHHLLEQIRQLNTNSLKLIWIRIEKNHINAAGILAKNHGIELQQSFP